MSGAAGPLTVLVLGVGGNVSQGILKALRRSELDLRVVAGCISPLAVGLYAADRAVVTPLARDDGFLPWLERTCRDEGVGAVLSGAEPVLEALAPEAERLREATGGAVAIVSPPETLEVGQDKLTTARWLEERGLAFPASADAADAAAVRALAEEHGFPLLAKPRRGKGGTGLVRVGSQEELDLVTGRDGIVVQEHLPDRAEFTAGCMVDSEGELRGSVVMRRELVEGTTYRAEFGEFPEVRDEAVRIAQALRPRGPLNVQLRLRDGRPVAFELNVRFSGTTPARARAGFNEVDAALRHFVLGEPMNLPRVESGVVLRYWNELYLPDGAAEALPRDGAAADPSALGAEVEDWGLRG